MTIQQDNAIWQFLHNYVAITAFFGWFVAQSIKVLIGVFREKKFNFKWFVGTGGMPSSHAAGVTAMAASVGLYEGVGTALFGAVLLFTIIVIFDAHGVRGSIGKQAEILNTIMDDIYWKKKIQEKKLKELIGHTRIEVIAGVLVGLTVAFGLYFLSRI